MVDIALVHPPSVLDPSAFRSSYLSAPLVHYGYGMLYLGTFLIENGYSVKVWNVPELYQWGRGLEIIGPSMFTDIQRKTPIVIGIELNWMHQSRGAVELAERLKKHLPDVFIVVGGVHASLFAREILTEYSTCVDGVLRGEAELSLLDLVTRIESGKPLDDVSGLTWVGNGKIVENPIAKVIEDIDRVPPYSPKKLGATSSFVVPTVNIARGPCSMRCVYCIGSRIPKLLGRQRMVCHSPNWILDQISILIDEGFSRLFFQDYFWSSGKKNLLRIAKALRKEKVNEKITYFNITSAPGFLDSELLEEFSRAGVDNIDYGVESGSQRVLNLVRRDVTTSQIREAVKTTVEKGIIPNTFWMVGFPSETMEDVGETARLLKETIEVGGVPRWVTPLIVVPKTELYEEPGRYGVSLIKRSFKDYMAFSSLTHNLNAWYPELVTHVTEHLRVHGILKAAFLLRMLIRRRANDVLEKARENQQTYAKYHSYLDFLELEKRVSASTLVTRGSFW